MISTSSYSQEFDLQGHRGARGLLPENTIPGMMKALELGVTTIEMDVVITADKQVLISHEPWMNPGICLDPEGNKIENKRGKEFNIYNMTYEQVRGFDCGSIGNSRFPEQQKISTSKPLLKDAILKVEEHIRLTTKYPVHYNIEIKSSEKTDNEYHPDPDLFSELVFNTVNNLLSWDRVIIQSFDERILRHWNVKYPEVKLAYLIEGIKGTKENLKVLGFKPSIYSPYFKLIKKDDIDFLHSQGIEVIPWTVNEKMDMSMLKEWGVDGLITDYPNRAADLGLTLKIPYKEE